MGDESERDDYHSHGGNGSDSHSEDESEEGGSESRKRGYDESWWNGNEFKKQQKQQQQIGRRRQQQKQEGRRMIEEIRGYLETVRRKCVYCFYQGSMSRAHQTIYRCPESRAQNAKELYISIKSRIRRDKTMGPYGGCSFCFVPQAWCRGWRRRVDGADGDFERVIGADGKVVRCQYEDVVVSILAMAIVFEGDRSETYIDGLEGRIRRGGGQGVEEEGDLIRYLGRAAEGGGIETSQLLQECWYAWQHLQRFQNRVEDVQVINSHRLAYIHAFL